MTVPAAKPKYIRGGPPLIMRSGLTGAWYVVSAYTDHGNGAITAGVKREVSETSARQLETLYRGYEAWRRGEPFSEPAS
jgi:hypothetical protein